MSTTRRLARPVALLAAGLFAVTGLAGCNNGGDDKEGVTTTSTGPGAPASVDAPSMTPSSLSSAMTGSHAGSTSHAPGQSPAVSMVPNASMHSDGTGPDPSAPIPSPTGQPTVTASSIR